MTHVKHSLVALFVLAISGPAAAQNNNAMPPGTVHVPTWNTPPVYVPVQPIPQQQPVQTWPAAPLYVQPVPSPYTTTCSMVGTFLVCN